MTLLVRDCLAADGGVHFSRCGVVDAAGVVFRAAIGGVEDKPIVTDGQLEVRQRMRVTMSCDHRVIDGATGAEFLQTVRTYIENPLSLII